MKKLLSTLALLVLTSMPLCAAPFVPENVQPGQFSINGQWIYFSPNSETKYYAVQASPDTNLLVVDGQRYANKLDQFYSGYRVGLGYTFCECERSLSLTWTELKARHSASAFPEPNHFLLSTAGPPNLTPASSFASAHQS